MEGRASGLSVAGRIVVMVVIAGLAFAGWWLMKHKGGETIGGIDLKGAQEKLKVGAVPEGVTTQKDYTYVPEEKLPPVKGASNYKWNANDPVVNFPINVWIGWLPIVAANHGFEPNTESIFYKKYKFKVRISLIDDPVQARDAFITGDSHILWGTLDMMALFAPGLMQDSRTAPRIYQQVDWSSGGDGIVVRDSVKNVADLSGKTIVYAQNSPSQYYLATLLIQGGVDPRKVSHLYTKTAFEASAAFVSDRSRQIEGCVSWAPDIYNISKQVPGTKLLSTTADASKLIADVWAARADFARDHPEIIKGLVAGIFEAIGELDTKADGTRKNPQLFEQACAWLAKGYSFPVEDIKKMCGDAHSTNFGENRGFFLDASNATNFERTWDRINYVYGQLGRVDKPVPFDKVMDFSVMKQLDASGVFSGQKDTYSASFSAADWGKVAEKPLLTKVIRIRFFTNSSNPFELKRDDYNRPVPSTMYDPNVKKTVDDVATMVKQFDRCLIKIVGHTDASMKGQVPEKLVLDLSQQRADAIKKLLIDKYHFPAEKFQATGMGWNQPADPNNPNDNAANRRVEINVYPVESG